MKKIINILVLILLLFVLTSCSITDILLTNNSTIKTTTLNHISTVVINSNLKVKTETYQIILGREIKGPYQGTGSGVIIKKDIENYYYILTNSHVVFLSNEYMHRYTVEDINNNVISAQLVARNPDYDLAVLKFRSEEEMEIMTFAESDPNIGDLVFSIGSPSGKNNIITAGKVLAFQNIENVKYKVIIHEAIIRNGSSGSMLINESYQIVGLNTWGFVDEGEIEEYVIGGATPVEKIKEFFESIKFTLN